jgi:hypothetical protein
LNQALEPNPIEADAIQVSEDIHIGDRLFDPAFARHQQTVQMAFGVQLEFQAVPKVEVDYP